MKLESKPFTWNYSQPDEYHFSLDSIETPWWIFQNTVNESWDNFSVLDLCAGCGVLGFELFFYRPEIRVDFIEVQDVYLDFFKKNQQMVCSDKKVSAETFNFYLLNYQSLAADPKFQKRYDLIVCNPPYFLIGQGKMSPSTFKNRCRFFLDSDLENLVEAILFTMKDNGRAFVLVRDLQEHKKDLISKWRTLCEGRARVNVVHRVRTTSLVEIKKN